MADQVKWWQYPADVLELAAKMRAQGHFWPYIAEYLYRRFECPYYDLNWLSRAVRAAQSGEDRPPETFPERRRRAMPMIPRSS
jgi:hypothetical protein